MIEKLLNEMNVSLYEGDRYFFNGIPVPRTTEILSSMLHEDYLMTWSNNIGLYQKKKYSETLKQAADIGSFTHEAIEKYTSAMKLAKECSDKLNEVSEKVNKIMLENGKLEDFTVSE